MKENPNKQKLKKLEKIYSPKREKFLDVPEISFRKKLNAFKDKLCASDRPAADASGRRMKNVLQYLKNHSTACFDRSKL